MIDLNKVVRNLKKRYSTVDVAENIEDPKDFVSTGNLAFDIISDGGIPFGYVTEFLGLSQSGKTLFLQKILANAQKDFNAIGIYADRENAYTNKRAEQLGINSANLIKAEPGDIPTPVDCFNFILDSISLIRNEDEDAYLVVLIDSIAAFDKDVALEKSDSGRKAKSIHEGLRKVLSKVDRKMMVLVANQVTYKIGVMFGDPRTSTAGESMKYYGTLRVALEDRKQIINEDRGKEVVGNWLGVEIIKTRLGPCYRSIHLPHFYDYGIDYYGGYMRMLADRGYLAGKNQTEFKAFKQSTVQYKRGEIKEQYNEFDVKKLFEKHPELEFETYPEYYEEK